MSEELLPQSQPSQTSTEQSVRTSLKKGLIILFAFVILVVAGYFLFIKKESSPTQEARIEQFFTLDKIVRTDLPEVKLAEYRERMVAAKVNRAMSEDGFNFRSFMEAGSIKKGVGDWEGAREIWEYVNVKRPKNSVSFANLGDLYANFLKDPVKAEQNYLKAIENDPSDPGYVRNLLELYEYQMPNKLGFSEQIFTEAIEKNPDKADFWLLLAHYEELAKNYDKAIEAWEKVKALEPSHKEVADREIKRIEELRK